MNSMSDGDDEEQDGNEKLPKILPTLTKNAPLKKGEKPNQSTIEVVCPDCNCDYLIPCIKMFFIKSFAGNRIQCHWPEKDSANDTGLVACPQCGIIFRVATNGDYQKMNVNWFKKPAKKAIKAPKPPKDRI